MQRSRIKGLYLVLSLLFALSGVAKAQTTDALGTFTPYSLYGIGEIVKQGTAINRGMGGIGVGVRDNRYINYTNPASITQRDTLSFMLDFGIAQKNFYNSDGKSKSAYNTFNMHNIVLTAPIYKKSALIVGITPYSDVGYKFESTENDKELVSQYGDIKYQKYGTGSISQFFLGASMNFFKHFSLGAEYIYYFGAIDRYSNVLFNSASGSMRTLNTGWDYALGASSGRVGLQYFGNLNKEKGVDLTIGATYRMATKLKGDFNRFAYAYDDAITDTITNTLSENAKIEIPYEISAGFSVRKRDKWMFGFDYMRQDWSKSSFEGADGVKFQPSLASYYKAGLEFTPNKYDIRYYMKRVTYRVGAYYEQSYVTLGSYQINAAGITFGMSLPIFRFYNAVNIAVDMGQRGSVKNNLVRERYVQFMVNISLHDIWFVKHQYQ
ncbi:MAG: hypothetical protein IKY70_05275 [Bacteroidales bacterium]|nr:hypothetical protein [Bacteroidales bacterium]